ncbi:MAG: peptidase M23 [Mameliella sp.]|nr:peptidase M23 [Antarctobacter heliothermus]MBT54150.1 peptidase M23 [Mameliella sp.]
MKTVLTFVAALLAAAPALAHEGGHLHPHGVESGMSLLPMAALIGVAALVAWNRR